MRLRHLFTAAGIVLSCSLAACSKGKVEPPKEKKEPAVPVEVMPLVRGKIESTLRLSTNLEAEQEVKVFARTSNRVAELLVEEGDRVERNQVLLRLEDDIQKTQVAKAKTRLLKAQQEFQRQTTLYEQQLISEQAFQDARFELKQLELALEDAERELEYTQVRASIAGTVARRLVKLGDHVNLNQHLFDIIDFNSIVARIYVPEKNFEQLRLNQPARVTATALGEETYVGHVKRISPIVESKTGLIKVTVGFQDIGQLRPGMYAEVEVVLATHSNALLISKKSVVYDTDQQMYVYRLRSDRRVERVRLEPKLADQFNIEPADGFGEGDQIVVAGHSALKDGALVRLPGDPEPGENQPAQSAARPHGSS